MTSQTSGKGSLQTEREWTNGIENCREDMQGGNRKDLTGSTSMKIIVVFERRASEQLSTWHPFGLICRVE